MKLYDNIIYIKGSKEDLNTYETFLDLYLLPLLATFIAAIIYYASFKINQKVQPLWVAVLVELFIFFFFIYLIDRFIENWRDNINYSYKTIRNSNINDNSDSDNSDSK